jgi:hypothetical protein
MTSQLYRNQHQRKFGELLGEHGGLAPLMLSGVYSCYDTLLYDLATRIRCLTCIELSEAKKKAKNMILAFIVLRLTDAWPTVYDARQYFRSLAQSKAA